MSRITNRCSGRGVDKMHAPLRPASIHLSCSGPYDHRAAAERTRYAAAVKRHAVRSCQNAAI
jgi:hypothetical protein